ncbi:MAG TPA: MFS transporter [Nitrososphaerales archaeon]|nr:MFS transporter [Nitrososphaerales archaeon]
MDQLRLKLHALLNSFANNISGPFVAFNVTVSGGSDILIGYVQSINSLASGFAQVVGGRLVDRFGRRLRLALVMSIVIGLIWLEAAVFQGANALAISYTAITIGLGFYLAGWNSFLGEATTREGRGSFLSVFARIASWGSLVALVLTTVITFITPSYTILFLISGIAFVGSSIFLRGQQEIPVEKQPMSRYGSDMMMRYYGVTAAYGLFWGFGWPLFTITTVKIVNMSLVEYAFSQFIAVAATIAFQALVGRMVDRNRMRSVFLGRLGLVVYPICYAFFTHAWEIYAINVFSGFTNSLLNVAYSAYLYDLAPVGRRGRYIAEFNLITGAATMAGSLSSGYLLMIMSAGMSLWLSLAYLYVVTAVGRLAAALLHLRL